MTSSVPRTGASSTSAASTGSCLSSTVPQLSRSYAEFAERYTSAELLELGPGVKTGIPCATTTRARWGRTGSRTPSPRRSVTARRASSWTSARRRTSTSCQRTAEYVGGVLAPGIEVSMDALFERAARLRKVDFIEPASVIGKTTVAALQSGVVYGFAGQVDGIVTAIRGELGEDARAIATGGLAELIYPHATTIERVDPFLTLEGLRLVWERNR